MANIYKLYKQRLIEISGRNRSLYSKKISKKYSFDIGNLLRGDQKIQDDFFDFLWRNKKYSFNLITKDHKTRIYENFNIEAKIVSQYKDTKGLSVEKVRSENLRRERVKRDEIKKGVTSQVDLVKVLKREIEEFARESGRYELYLGYPFVEGSIGKEMVIKAPLIMFPIKINVVDDMTVTLELKHDEPVQLNKVFALAYSKHFKLNIDDVVTEFDSNLAARFKTVNDFVKYLKNAGFNIKTNDNTDLVGFDGGTEPMLGDSLKIKNACVLGRFPLANSIYNDYNALEKRKLTTDAINELLESRNIKAVKKPNSKLFSINELDYAQESTIEQINKFGNAVIYGPPGTGKSQTIVNVITDALSKNKRVLVVSQKKAALDVVYNRLGNLNNKAMYVLDPEKDKQQFYAQVKSTHFEMENYVSTHNMVEYEEIESSLKREIESLESLSNVLFEPTSYGINLQQMYANSHLIGKNTNEYDLYTKLQNSELINLNFFEIEKAVKLINQKNKAQLYFKYIEKQRANPIMSSIQSNLDIHTLNQAKSLINKVINKKRLVPFDMGKYPNSKKLLAFYFENGMETEKELKPIIKVIAKLENPTLTKLIRTSILFFPLYPVFRFELKVKQDKLMANFNKLIGEVNEFVSEYEVLKEVLDKKGYYTIVDSLLSGNTMQLKLLYQAIEDYVELRDMKTNLKSLSDNEKIILNFAYEHCETAKGFTDIIGKILPIRTYHEILNLEDKYKTKLSAMMDYENIKNRIIALKKDLNKAVYDICDDRFKSDYVALYNKNAENKNFLYQIQKQQNFWAIRKLMEVYSELMLTMYPCWLLSPETVSTIMPLKKNLFDLIIFDEASQIFIESTLPVIFRGKHIVVAGDNKQLRPTATFMRRYMGNDVDELDYSSQAALEVESLLDLATSRYNASNLTYHYRSQNEELINFSNYLFYDGKLQIAPNITKNVNSKPIERIKVSGRWIDRKNHEEAVKVVELIKKILKTRKKNETIGVITFNAEQEEYIENLLDIEANKSPWFKNALLKEHNRKVNGEDISLFVKNLENVQGDERDIIIFSIGYAPNEQGKVTNHFGPLNLAGGENRLNVAVTRAKQKIYVVTSIEPDQLNVENSKNLGPRIFKKYLQYVKAVSSNKKKEVEHILSSINPKKQTEAVKGIEQDIAKELSKHGYDVDINLGGSAYKLSAAVYDKTKDKYIVGIECDHSAFEGSESVIERDVFRARFMQARGWTIVRVWSREWWQNKQKVLNKIIKVIEKNKK